MFNIAEEHFYADGRVDRADDRADLLSTQFNRLNS